MRATHIQTWAWRCASGLVHSHFGLLSKPATMPELPHRNFVSLLRYSGKCYLHHAGTDEYCEVSEDSRVSFDGDCARILRLSDGGAGGAWANDLLKYSLHQNAGDNGQPFVWDKEVEVATWLHEKQRSLDSKIVEIGGKNFQAYFYEHCPADVLGPRLFFVAQAIVDLLGYFANSKWLCKNLGAWHMELRDMGMGTVHIRKSAKALLASARTSGGALQAADVASAGQEYSFSIAGLIMLASRLASCTGKWSSDDSRGKARSFLKEVLASFVGSESFVVRAQQGDSWLVIVVEAGFAKWKDLTFEGRAAKSVVTCAGWPDEGMVLDELLLVAWKLAHASKSQRATTVKELGAALWSEAVLVIGSIIEHKASSCKGFFKDTDNLAWSVVRPNKCAKRIPIQLKVDLVQLATATQGIKRTASFVACQNELAKRGKVESSASRSGARWFTQDCQLQYLASPRYNFDGIKNISLVLDGIRAAGEEFLFVCLWSHECQQGCWLPPQALGGTRHDRARRRRGDSGEQAQTSTATFLR